MFGMALKFIEMNLNPFGNIKDDRQVQRKGSQLSNSKQQDFQKQNRRAKSRDSIAYVKSINSKQNIDPFETYSNPRSADLTTQQNLTIIQQLRQSQRQVIQDFKKSVSRSKSSRNLPQIQPKLFFKGQPILSKIEEVSEEYLENSHPTFYSKGHNGQGKSDGVSYNPRGSFNLQDQSNLIKQIVKSVLIDNEEDKHFSYIEQKQSPFERNLSSLINGGESNFSNPAKSELISAKNPQMASEFVKNLFFSLNLINRSDIVENQQELNIKHLTNLAKHNFNSLKGQTYNDKLNEMISKSGYNSNQLKQRNINLGYYENGGLGVSRQPKVIKSQNDNGVPRQPVEIVYSHQQSRRPSLSKQRRVTLVSPETCSQIKIKRQNTQKQLYKAVEFIITPRRMKKYCFSKRKIEDVLTSFSMDFKFMSYTYLELKCANAFNCITHPFNSANQNTRLISLPNNIVNVSKGFKTKNFLGYKQGWQKNNQIQNPCENLCFSILFKDRTYDFECESQQVRNNYYDFLRMLIRSTAQISEN